MVKKHLRKIRFFYWYLKSYFLRYGGIILFSFIFGFLFFKVFSPFLKKAIAKKPTQRIGLVGSYTEATLPKDVQNLISLGLTSVSSSGSAIPSLSSGWKIENNGKTYIFRIKDQIYWHDGKKFEATDINYNFKDVKGEVIDSKTYKFTLSEPFSPFLSLLSQPLFRKRLLGLGKYKVAQIEKSNNFIKTLKLESKNNFLIYKFFPNEKAAISAFKLGEVDVLKGISNPLAFRGFKNLKIEPELKLDTVAALFFNTRVKFFKEKAFRQALTYAVPDKDIKEVKAFGPISPISALYNENVKKYNFDLNEAKRLLKKSGEASVSGKIVITAIRPYNKYLKNIANSWRKLGLTVEERVENVLPYRFDVLLAGQEVFADPDQYVYWHSRSERNLTGYSSQKIDKFLEDGRKILDFEERKQKYLDFQKYLVEDCPAAFLYYPTVFNISRLK